MKKLFVLFLVIFLFGCESSEDCSNPQKKCSNFEVEELDFSKFSHKFGIDDCRVKPYNHLGHEKIYICEKSEKISAFSECYMHFGKIEETVCKGEIKNLSCRVSAIFQVGGPEGRTYKKFACKKIILK